MANQDKTQAELYRAQRKARAAQAAKKKEKSSKHFSKKTTAVVAVLVVIALVGGIVGFSLSNAGVTQMKRVAFTVGDVEVTQPEYNFYYASVFSNYFNYSYQYDTYYGAGMGAAYTGYDYKVSPDQQAYKGEIEGFPEGESPMWTDYIEYSAMQNIKYIKASVAYAEENKIELTEEDTASIEESMSSMRESAKSSNYSLAAYLRTYYGAGITEELVEQIVTEQTLATRVSTVKTEEFEDSYTDKDIEAEYKASMTDYGVVSLRQYVINAETTKETDEDGEETETVSKEAMAAAKKAAEEFAKNVKDEDSFKTYASLREKEAGNEDYKDLVTDDSITLIADQAYAEASSAHYDDEAFGKWLADKDTEEFSTYVAETADQGYTVYMMVNPLHKAPDTFSSYDVRHILIKFPETAEGEEAPEVKDASEFKAIDFSKYDATVALDVTLDTAKNPETFDEAQTILKEYLDGEQTADNFGALAKEYTADGNGDVGGLYEDVAPGDMVAEFESWALADGREAGDVGMVETTYGYHIMYFVDRTIQTWEDTVKSALSSSELTTFTDELTADEAVEIAGESDKAMTEVEEFVVSLAKTQIRSIAAQAAQQK